MPKRKMEDAILDRIEPEVRSARKERQFVLTEKDVEKICDSYCKKADEVAVKCGGDVVKAINMMERICQKCPLGKL